MYHIEVDELQFLVDRFEPGEGDAARQSKKLTVDLLSTIATPLDRRWYRPGHITASGIVLSPDRTRLLLVFHRRLERWLQPGGHVEPQDQTIAEPARREVLEETGAILRADEPPRLVGIDVHGIPAARGEPEHLHHDLVFSFVAEFERLGKPAEVRDVVWCSLDHLEAYRPDDALRRSIARAVAEKL